MGGGGGETLYRYVFVMLELIPFQNAFGELESKQEVTKVISLIIKWRKLFSLLKMGLI